MQMQYPFNDFTFLIMAMVHLFHVDGCFWRNNSYVLYFLSFLNVGVRAMTEAFISRYLNGEDGARSQVSLCRN